MAKAALKMLEQLLIDPKPHDVEFEFPEENITIKAIKAILSNNSEVLSAMFNCEWQKSAPNESITKITLTDVNSKIFQLFLKYCYIKNIEELNLKEIPPLLLVADKYNHKELIGYLQDYVITKDHSFLIQILGELSEISAVVESIGFLKEYIIKKILENPHKFMLLTDTFGYISVSLKELIFELFSFEYEKLHEDTKLERMIEYGEKIVQEAEVETSLQDVLKDVLSVLYPQRLSAAGMSNLFKYKLFNSEQLNEFLIEIMKNNKINTSISSKAMNYDLSKAVITGSMLYTTGSARSISDQAKWSMDLNLSTLKIILDQPYRVHSFVLGVEKIWGTGHDIQIKFANTADEHWKLDDTHWATIDNQIDTHYYRFNVKNIKKHKYWKIVAEQPMNEYDEPVEERVRAGGLTMYTFDNYKY